MTKSMQRTKHDLLIAALLALAGFVLYAATAAPSVATLFDDSLEFQVVAPALGIAHPSGYPLYTLLGKLATLLLPFRDGAGRLNLFSALCAAAAVGILYLVAAKLAGNRAAAAVATIAFAISPAWWSQATIAEVYALHGLLVALFIYCLLRWEEREKGERGRGGEREKRRLALGCGAGLWPGDGAPSHDGAAAAGRAGLHLLERSGADPAAATLAPADRPGPRTAAAVSLPAAARRPGDHLAGWDLYGYYGWNVGLDPGPRLQRVPHRQSVRSRTRHKQLPGAVSAADGRAAAAGRADGPGADVAYKRAAFDLAAVGHGCAGRVRHGL